MSGDRQRRIPPSQRLTEHFTITMSKETLDRLYKVAQRRGVSMAALAREGVEAVLNQQEAESAA